MAHPGRCPNRNCNGHRLGYVDANRDLTCHTDRHADGHGDPDTDFHATIYGNLDSNPLWHRDPNHHLDGHLNRHAHCDCNRYADSHGHPYRDCHAHIDNYLNAYPHPNRDALCHPHAHRDAYCNPYPRPGLAADQRGGV
jgi:hypothetical protein